MGLFISLIVYCSFLGACAECKNNPVLTYANWIGAMVLIPFFVLGGMAEFAYLDYPYILEPFGAAIKSATELKQ